MTSNFSAASEPSGLLALSIVAVVVAAAALILVGLWIYMLYGEKVRRAQVLRLAGFAAVALALCGLAVGVTLHSVSARQEFRLHLTSWAKAAYGVSAGAESIDTSGWDSTRVIVHGEILHVVYQPIGDVPLLIDTATGQELPHRS